MTATVFLGETPDVVIDRLERRAAPGQDGHDEVWFYFEPTLHGEIDWPPT